MISACGIEGGKHLRALQLLQVLTDRWQRVAVLDGHAVEGPVIYRPTRGPVLLQHWDQCTGPWTLTFLYHVLGLPSVQLLLEVLPLFGVDGPHLGLVRLRAGL